MKLKSRHVVIAGLLIALAAASWSLSRFGTVTTMVFTGKQRHDPDYVVENFRNIVMAPNGKPQYELRGAKLLHYGDDGSSTIEQPYIIQYAPGQAPTHARANQGYLPPDTSYIRLTENVQVSHGRDPQSTGAEIRTQQLTLELDKQPRRAKPP